MAQPVYRSILCAIVSLGLACAVCAQTKQPAKEQSKDAARVVKIGESPLLKTDWVGDNAVDLAGLKGNVVLVFYWSTDCAVCLDKMAELRDNVKGWRSKPFVIVAVNRNANESDFNNYLNIERQLRTQDPQLRHVYYKKLMIDQLYRPGRLPASFLMDAQGVLQYSHFGRIPPEAWDQIAELLP